MIHARWFDGAASFSEDMRHRYHLTRRVLDPLPGAFKSLGWLMFNPSTATASENDATIRKVIGFTRRAGYCDLEVVNLFSLRARNPKEVAVNLADASNDDNLRAIQEVASRTNVLVCAWGTLADNAWGQEQVRTVLDWLPLETTLLCIDTTKSRSPVHPLMQGYAKGLRTWTPNSARLP